MHFLLFSLKQCIINIRMRFCNIRKNQGLCQTMLVQPSARIIKVPFKNLVMVNLVTWAVMASKPFCLQSLITAFESVSCPQQIIYKATRAAFYPNAKLIIAHGLLCLLVYVLLYYEVRISSQISLLFFFFFYFLLLAIHMYCPNLRISVMIVFFFLSIFI